MYKRVFLQTRRKMYRHIYQTSVTDRNLNPHDFESECGNFNPIFIDCLATKRKVPFQTNVPSKDQPAHINPCGLPKGLTGPLQYHAP